MVGTFFDRRIIDSFGRGRLPSGPTSRTPEGVVGRQNYGKVGAAVVNVTVPWNTRRTSEATPSLRGVELNGAHLQSVNLNGVDLFKAKIRGSDLRQADLRGAHLVATDLTGSRLDAADLAWADLRRAKLQGTSFAGANLWNTEFRSADLTDADLTNAQIGYASFDFSDLSAVRGLNHTRFRTPATIGPDSLFSLIDSLPLHFLQGCGVQDELIEFLKSRAGAIQFYSASISYSHADKFFTQRLHDALQSEGIRCRLDDKDAIFGEDILEMVNNAIRLHDRVGCGPKVRDAT